MHFMKGEFIPKGFGTGLYKGFCAVVEEESDDSSSDEAKEESNSDFSSDSVEDF